MAEEKRLEGKTVTFVIPHTPESVGYESGEHFLSIAAYHRHYYDIVSERGAKPELVYLSDSGPPSLRDEYNIRTEPVTIGTSYGMEFSVSLYRSLLRTDADVVHVHGYNQLNVLPILASLKLTDARVVVQNHGSPLDHSSIKHQLWYQLLRYSFRIAVDEVISVNEGELENLKRSGVDSRKLVHLPNAVDVDLFRPMDQDECRETLGMDREANHLLFVGKITENKGVTYLAEAMCELPGDTRLTLVYSSVDEAEFERVESILSECGLQNRVSFVGEVDQGELANYYNAADICVFPSVNEGFGIVTLESMACEIPVVATTEHASGGHIVDGENAMVAKAGSAAALVTNIEELLNSPELRERLGRHGRETVLERYTWDRIGAQLANIYCGDA